MIECPICKEHPGTYYKCFTGALAKLLGRYPTIVDAREKWLLLAPEPSITNQGEFDDLYRKRHESYYRRGKQKAPIVFVSTKGDRPIHLAWHYPRVEYNTFASFQKIQAEQERFLVFLCPACAKAAHQDLELEPFEFWQLFADECRCCGYFTVGPESWQKLCMVCGWDECPSNMLWDRLEEAQEAYRRYGAISEDRADRYRPPRVEEHPRFYRYFG